MNSNDLESRLSRLRFRPVPADWRTDILARVQSVERAAAPGDLEAPARPAPWWSGWLWPHPAAWAGLAAAWLLILGFNLSAAEPVEGQGTSLGVNWSLWAVQRQSIAELIALGDGVEPPVRPAPRTPSPRSESPTGRIGVG